MIGFRLARRDDVPAVVSLLSDDILGATREGTDLTPYLAAFERMETETGNHLIVGTQANGTVIATYQITFISGLSLGAARRAQVESVRIATSMRAQGLGHAMFDDVFARARAAGCTLVQLTMNKQRKDAQRFYESLGFSATHDGFKRPLA